MIPFRPLYCVITAALLAGPSTLLAISAEEAKAGHAIINRYADAVIGVEVVVTIKGTMGDRPMPVREIPRDVNGTVVAPSGLTVISLASIDPRAGGLAPNVRLEEPEFKEVKLRLADGTEIPAQIAMKDADLDLAFVVPQAGVTDHVFTAVDLDQPAEGVLLETYYDLARAAKAMQRTPALRVVHTSGIVERPRRMYLLNEYSPGCPVFAADGRLLGVTVRFGSNERTVGNIVLPAADIAEIAQQAAAIKLEPPTLPLATEEAP